MNLFLKHSDKLIGTYTLTIPGSKSESNRLLILQKILNNSFKIENISDSDDTKALIEALNTNSPIKNIGHAGTTFRFLTAYFSSIPQSDVILTGSQRMKERPIKILVEVLNELGANITYLENEGYPPIKIKGTNLELKNYIEITANISSQYISALILLAPSLKKGLQIKLLKKPSSSPYIKMTQQLLTKIGIENSWENDIINVKPYSKTNLEKLTVEADWSSASYIYSLVSLAKKLTVFLPNFRKDSLQGDSKVAKYYNFFGIKTSYHPDGISLTKVTNPKKEKLILNLINEPDLAQTITITCLGLDIDCLLTGLHTLKIKETNRLQALKNEIEKFGAQVTITNDTLDLKCSKKKLNENVIVETYNDHRMALAFAPLTLVTSLTIQNANVISKSYSNYWEHLKKIGIQIFNSL